jgi:tetratricopeptide (TPR) repeat protein
VDLFQQGRNPDVRDETARCLADYPDDGRFWQLHGIAQWHLGACAEARKALETASCLRPLAPLGQVALAATYLATGHGDVARLMYRHLAELEACPAELMPKVATGLGQLGEYADALGVCTRLVRIEPRHHAAFFGMAFYMARLGYPLASLLDPLVKAYNLAPRMLAYRLNLALLYAELDQPARAYFLLGPVPPEAVPAGFSLEKIAEVFAAVGDEERCRAYRERMTRAATGGEDTPVWE